MQDDLLRQREHFNSIAQEYFESRRGGKQVVLHDLLYRALFKNIKIEKEKLLVLEPMCGFGEGKSIIENFFENEIIYEGFDYSEEIVKCAKQLDNEMNVYVQDVTTFHSDKRYDIIVLIGGLHHVPDYAQEVLKNMAPLLCEGGLFINVEPTYNNFIVGRVCKSIYKKNSLFDEKTERRFSLKELNGMYQKAGLNIKRQIYPGLLAYLLWYNPDAFPKLNKGSIAWVRRIFKLDSMFMNNFIGKFLSVATFSVLQSTK